MPPQTEDEKENPTVPTEEHIYVGLQQRDSAAELKHDGSPPSAEKELSERDTSPLGV